MSIRFKLYLLFSITMLTLVGIGLYAVSIYRENIKAEEIMLEKSYQEVTIAQDTSASFNKQLTAWKNVLLRGNKSDSYHKHLSSFYEAERTTRKQISSLVEQVSNLASSHQLAIKLQDEHLRIGKIFREAIRIFNNTDENPAAVSDRFVYDIENIPQDIINEILLDLREKHHHQVNFLAEHRHSQEHLLAILLTCVLTISVTLYFILVNQNVARPAEKAQYLADVIEHAQQVAHFGTWDWDSKLDKHFWSQGVYDILTINPDTPASIETFINCLEPAQRESTAKEISRAMTQCCSFELEANIDIGHGQTKTLLQKGEVRQLGGGKTRMTSLIYDITDRKQVENRLAYMASYDSLTGLTNRSLFTDRLKHAIAKAERSNKKVALLFMDLDHFKQVNDVLGHPIGDKLLKQVADRLRVTLREEDTASRLGGDEFTIIIEGFELESQIVTVAKNVLKTISAPYDIENHDVHISTSIGITTYPQDGKDTDTLIRNADNAMYRAKEMGRNNYHFFTEELNQRAKQRLNLETGLRYALEKQEFELHYQPKIQISTGIVVGVEALLRWKKDDQYLQPDTFIPILEETGQIHDVGRWIISTAYKATESWREKGYASLHTAVNLSTMQLRKPDVKELLVDLLDGGNLPSNGIEFELTESALIDSGRSQDMIKELESLGVTLAIDDFGTGYSSLSYLRKFSVDNIKIDRSFIKDINIDQDDDAVISAIIALSHSLGMHVTAEGVETSAQMAFLNKLGCDYAQGYLIAKPMPENDLLTWLNKLNTNSEGNRIWSAKTNHLKAL